MSVHESCPAEAEVSMVKRRSLELLPRSPLLKLRPLQQGEIFVVVRRLGRNFCQHETKFVMDLQPGMQAKEPIDKCGNDKPREHRLLQGAAGEKKRRANHRQD